MSEEFLELVRDFRRAMESLARQKYYPSRNSEHGPIASEGAEGQQQEERASSQEGRVARESLALIREDLGDCQRCALSETRSKIVFGNGSESARLMFVGEAPGAEEDRQGLPFVGPSGELLDKMISAMGFQRDSVYVGNVLKCRPPNNRNPKAEEIAHCQGFLTRQIRSIGPEVIVTLGKPAAHLLLGGTASMSSLRGRWHDFEGIPLMPTFHPAYLLRDPSKKREAWSDLQQVMKRLGA